MRRFPPNSDGVWAKADHSVRDQELSDGHQSSLHRRVRGPPTGGSMSSPSSPTGPTDNQMSKVVAGGGEQPLRRFLSEADEREALGVLRDQFHHEQRITSDDVRFVVRAIASHGGSVSIPPDFPPSRWILEFKRVHGFVQLNSFAYGAPAAAPLASSVAFGLPERLSVGNLNRNASFSSRFARTTVSSNSSSGANSEGDEDVAVDSGRNGHHGRYTSAGESGFSTRYSSRSPYDDESPVQQQSRHQHQQQQQQRRSMVVDDRRGAGTWQQPEAAGGEREDLGSNLSSGSFDSENGITTGASNCSSSGGPGLGARRAVSMNSESHYEPSDSGRASTEKRGYKLSHTVPPETWEKAIAAVEQQGMSLRAAAKIYGVHFAALHRRVKKRAQGGQASKANSGYFHPSDEAGIMRVVVARAELGVLMTFDELMKLVETAALRKLPDISVEAARTLMVRFQSRNEQSIRHIIVDWPPPRPAAPASSNGASPQQHYYLEHPGYAYGPQPQTDERRPFESRIAGGGPTSAASAAAVTTASAPLFEAPSRVDPFSSNSSSARKDTAPASSNNVKVTAIGAAVSPRPTQPLDARVVREKESGRSHPVMFV
ncbi:hypothetical protein BBJ28_00023626 [Nothophytophthora sp. Chile5]|nr:hypothetical protein BBJ28_00023626 [Nothophytophthora sp. Chile5]